MSLTEKITAAVETYLSGLTNKDLEVIMGLFAEHCWVEDPVGSPRKNGREAVRAFYAAAVGMDLVATLEGEIRIAGNQAAFPFRLERKIPDGKMVLHSIDVMGFDDEGRITSMCAYFGDTNRSIEKA
jgi:steroid delta-isomerase